MSLIEIRNVVKRFESVTAVAGVDLDVSEGECFGLLGPNGAGKTSLVRMIIASSPLSDGRITVNGHDVARAARRIKSDLGVVPQEENLDPDLDVLHNLLTFARYFDMPGAEARQRALEVLRFFELDERQKAKIDELSGGMKRRLLIARALLNRPSLIVLDEPTVGLDPQTKYLVWQRLGSLKQRGVTLLLCTQNMDEAWRICDRLAVMNEGKIIALGSPHDLLTKHGGSRILEARLRSDENKERILAALSGAGVEWQMIEDTLYIFEEPGRAVDQDLMNELNVVNQHVPSLEDVFLKLTGRALRE